MKKLLVVLSVLLAVALIAGSAFAINMYDPEQRAAKLASEKAAPVKIGGEFTFSTMTTFDAPEGAGGFYNMYVDISLWPDEFNSFLFEIAGDGSMSDQTLGNLKNTYWEWSTDVGKALDLPVSLKNTAGKTSLYTRKYEVSGLAYERPVRPAMDPIPWKFAVGTDMFTATLGLGFGSGVEAENDLGVLVEIPELGPVSAEIFYLAGNDADMKGDLGFNVKALDLLDGKIDFAAGFDYNMISEGWAYGIGVNTNLVDNLRAAVSINGNDADALNILGIDAAYAFTDVFGIDAALGLGFFEGADTFQGAEFSVYAKVGVSKWNVGYQIKDGTGFNYVPAVANAQGGLFVAVDTNF